jgi:DNA-binding XRE family transcriptional regulator
MDLEGVRKPMQNTLPETTCANECVGDLRDSKHILSVTNNQKNYKLSVGARIRQLRSNAEMTQDALSDRCGIFRTYLSRIESGSANPTLVVLVALAESLGVEPAALFREN